MWAAILLAVPAYLAGVGIPIKLSGNIQTNRITNRNCSPAVGDVEWLADGACQIGVDTAKKIISINPILLRAGSGRISLLGAGPGLENREEESHNEEVQNDLHPQ